MTFAEFVLVSQPGQVSSEREPWKASQLLHNSSLIGSSECFTVVAVRYRTEEEFGIETNIPKMSRPKREKAVHSLFAGATAGAIEAYDAL